MSNKLYTKVDADTDVCLLTNDQGTDVARVERLWRPEDWPDDLPSPHHMNDRQWRRLCALLAAAPKMECVFRDAYSAGCLEHRPVRDAVVEILSELEDPDHGLPRILRDACPNIAIEFYDTSGPDLHIEGSSDVRVTTVVDSRLYTASWWSFDTDVPFQLRRALEKLDNRLASAANTKMMHVIDRRTEISRAMETVDEYVNQTTNHE